MEGTGSKQRVVSDSQAFQELGFGALLGMLVCCQVGGTMMHSSSLGSGELLFSTMMAKDVCFLNEFLSKEANKRVYIMYVT